ncbi:MAG TPA: Ig-like domain-containing protein [Anaerolineae bacterium]|nr:Ig-like domain-containing protein [Anaerolineae bacterium]
MKGWQKSIWVLVLMLVLAVGCREDDEPVTPTAVPVTSGVGSGAEGTDTAEPTNPPLPTATEVDWQLLSSSNIMSSELQPKVVGQLPAAGQEVDIEEAIEIYFDQPMDAEATGEAWSFVDMTGMPVAGEISWPQPRILRFKPSETLKPGVRYRGQLGETARSAEGVALLAGLSFDFDTVGDLEVTQTAPANRTNGVANDSQITVIFNRPVVPVTFSTDRGELPQPLVLTPATEGSGEWVSSSVYVFKPDEPLHGGVSYNAVIQAEIINGASATGAQMRDDWTWSFSVTPPTLGYISLVGRENYPRDNYANLRLDQAFRFHFNQSMEPVSTATAVSFTDPAGSPVSLAFGWADEAFRTLVVTPTEQLALGTKYTLRLAPVAMSQDGGRIVDGFSWSATTVSEPGVAEMDPPDGTEQPWFSSVFRVRFASPMDRASLADKVIVTPAPLGDANGRYDAWDWSLRIYGLEPSTDYTVQFLPGMTDIYGHPMPTPEPISFRTAAYSPYVRFNVPSALAFYRQGGNDNIWVTYRNVNDVDMAMYRVAEPVFSSLLGQTIDRLNFEPPADNLVWSERQRVSTVENESGYARFQLGGSDGGSLEPGFYFMTVDSPQLAHESAHFQAYPVFLGTANVTLKTTGSEVLAWVTDLATGEPLAGVPVTVYDNFANKQVEGVTDENGLFYQRGLSLDVNSWDRWYYALARNDEVLGMAVNHWTEGIEPYDFGILTDYYDRGVEAMAYVYTERPLYRPGHTVAIKGIVRHNDDLQYSLPAFDAVKVQVRSYDETIYEEEVGLSEFGSFVIELPLAEEATLGSYYISVEEIDRGWIGGGMFDVAEYRKPTYQVEVEAPAEVMEGEALPVEVGATFFSGGSVVSGDVSWSVAAYDFVFQPEDNQWRGYQFDDVERDVYYYGYWGASGRGTIATGEGVTDGNGQYQFDLATTLASEDGSQSLTIEARVSDVGGNSVSGRTTAIIHATDLYGGIQAGRTVAVAGEEMDLEVVVLDWAEQAVANWPVMVKVVERQWSNVQEENEEGQTIWRSSVEEIGVAEFEANVGSEGTLRLPFTPERSGVYRAYVTVLDREGREAVASTYFWVSGNEYVSWRRLNDHSFDLITDGGQYQPGDTAELLIAAPFQGRSYALVTVERGHVQSQDVVPLDGNSAIYRLPITAEMAPNVFVSVVVIKGVDETNPTPDFKVGMTQLLVDRVAQELSIEVRPSATVLGPQDEVTYDVRVTNAAGEPVEAELSLALVDLAALSLSSRAEQPILSYFYQTQWLRVRTALLLTNNMDAFNDNLEEEIKGGGGGGGDFGVIGVREDFPDTAFWEGQVMTDGDGRATVTVPLPDNLTTWRLDVRAVTKETLVGETTVDIQTRRPLMVTPQTPRFFVVGDEAELGAVVHNNTEETMTVAVTLETMGVRLADPAVQTVQVLAGQQTYVSWTATVTDSERVDLVVSVASGDYFDASRPQLATLPDGGIPVYRYEVPETVGTSGQLLAGGVAVESLQLPVGEEFDLSEGSLTVAVAPSLAAAVSEGFEYLRHYPYECTEQIVSRFLPNVATTQAMIARGIENPALAEGLEQEVQVALQKLYQRQKIDGGWPWWDSGDSQTLVTAYVVLGLVEAQAAGYDVSEGVINQGARFLTDHLDEVDRLNGREKLNRQAFLLYVLTQVEQAPTYYLSALYEERESLDEYAQAYLLMAMQTVDAEDPRIDVLVSDLISAVNLSAAGAHWDEVSRDVWNWNSDTRTTALVLKALIGVDAENPIVANGVRWLMNQQRNGHWQGTQETAWSLLALTDWMVVSGELEADYMFEVALNGRLLGSGKATTANIEESWQWTGDISELDPMALNRLAIGRDDGAGNLYYTTYLEASLPVAALEPVDQGIIINRAYYGADDDETPVLAAEQGETLVARLTIVVPQSVYYVVIEDSLPAGLEAVDTSLLVSEQVNVPSAYSGNDWERQGWGWWYFDHVELRDEKVVISADYLPAGTYEYVYLVRAQTRGRYQTIPPVAYEFYFPDVYGRGAGAVFEVK